MWFLIAQILILLLLAAALGAALGVWWVKRRYEDVTETHDDLLAQADKLDALAKMPTRDDLKAELKAGLGDVSSSVAALKMPDLSPVEQRLAQLEETMRAFNVPAPDFSPVERRLAAIETKAPDLAPIQRRLELIESIIKAPDVAMDQVRSRINAIEAAVAQVSQSVGQVSQSVGQVSDRVSKLGNPDLSPIEAKLSDLETAFLSLKMPETDLGPVHASLANLGLSVDQLKTTSNVDPVAAQLGQLKVTLGQMGEHLDNAHKLDFDAVMQRIDALNAAVASVKPAITGLDARPNLDALHQRFAGVEQQLNAINPEIEQQHRRALAPVERRMAGLQEALGSMPETDLGPVIEAVHNIDSREDLVAVENRLTAIEYSLAALHHMLRSRAEAAMAQPWQTRAPLAVVPSTNAEGRAPQQPVPPPRPPRETDPINPVRRPGQQANLLVEPAFGPADNLELIHGVGPILRSMLNDRGIYYFWQVAEWTPDDVTQIDAQLMEFRGRIKRDDWVRHAGQLAALPTSAKRPVSQYGSLAR